MIAITQHPNESIILRVNYSEAMYDIIDVCNKYGVSYDYTSRGQILHFGAAITPRLYYYVVIKDIPFTNIMDFWKEINKKSFLIFVNRKAA